MKFIIFLFLFFAIDVRAQHDNISIGTRFQQALNMYNENGIVIEYHSKNILNDQLFFGASYISSRFGSAFTSNAIIQDNILLNSTYVFSASSLSPLIRLNAGYCLADYKSSLFDDIDASMPLLSIEIGARYGFDFPLKVQTALGYNFITSDGSSGIGTVYPLFVQCSLLWSFSL